MGILILNIDTAFDTACISLAEDGVPLLFSENETRNDHAAWLLTAIADLMKQSRNSLQDLKAVAVNNGPGSYTGIRIGLSAAKGLCYALQIPLITVNSLEVMALDAILELKADKRDLPVSDMLFCPMIDARRMEVFAAVYNADLITIMKPAAYVLNSHSFDEILGRQKILFFGNGSIKFQRICLNPDAIFKKFSFNPLALASLTYKNFIGNNFAGLAYTEPFYLKEFFTSGEA